MIKRILIVTGCIVAIIVIPWLAGYAFDVLSHKAALHSYLARWVVGLFILIAAADAVFIGRAILWVCWIIFSEIFIGAVEIFKSFFHWIKYGKAQ